MIQKTIEIARNNANKLFVFVRVILRIVFEMNPVATPKLKL